MIIINISLDYKILSEYLFWFLLLLFLLHLHFVKHSQINLLLVVIAVLTEAKNNSAVAALSSSTGSSFGGVLSWALDADQNIFCSEFMVELKMKVEEQMVAVGGYIAKTTTDTPHLPPA